MGDPSEGNAVSPWLPRTGDPSNVVLLRTLAATVVVVAGCASARPLPPAEPLGSVVRRGEWEYELRSRSTEAGGVELVVTRSRSCQRFSRSRTFHRREGEVVSRINEQPSGASELCDRGPASDVRLVLRGGRGGPLAAARTDEDGRVRIHIPSDEIARAGRPLRAVVAGIEIPDEIEALVVRHQEIAAEAERRAREGARQRAIAAAQAELAAGRCTEANSRTLTAALDRVRELGRLLDDHSMIFEPVAHQIVVLGDEAEEFRVRGSLGRGTFHAYAVGLLARPELSVRTTAGLTGRPSEHTARFVSRVRPGLIAGRSVPAGGDDLVVTVRGAGCTLLFAYEQYRAGFD